MKYKLLNMSLRTELFSIDNGIMMFNYPLQYIDNKLIVNIAEKFTISYFRSFNVSEYRDTRGSVVAWVGYNPVDQLTLEVISTDAVRNIREQNKDIMYEYIHHLKKNIGREKFPNGVSDKDTSIK